MKVTRKRGTLALNKDHSHYAQYEYTSLGFLNIKNHGECEVILEGWETTDIPHFHIVDKDNNTLCCIDMYNPIYYRGHSNDKHIKLSKDECEKLNNIMKSKDDIFTTISEWYLGCKHWWGYENDLTNWKKDETLQPDYTKLP